MKRTINSVLVTGATGFLGFRLCETLRRANFNVVGLGRNREQLQKLEAFGVSTKSIDLRQKLELEEFAPEVIIHCAAKSAAYGSNKDFWQDNVEATRNVLKYARHSGVKRIINISSPSIYFRYCDQLNVSEDTPCPKPVNAYAKTKRQAELICLETADLEVINLRPRGIYGPGDRSLLPSLLRASNRFLPRFRNAIATIDLTYVDDVVAAILLAIQAPASCSGQSFNISSGESVEIKRIVEQTFHLMGCQAKWRALPFPPTKILAHALVSFWSFAKLNGEPPVTPYILGLFAFRQSLDISKAKQMLGYQPKYCFDRGLEKTFQDGCYADQLRQ